MRSSPRFTLLLALGACQPDFGVADPKDDTADPDSDLPETDAVDTDLPPDPDTSDSDGEDSDREDSAAVDTDVPAPGDDADEDTVLNGDDLCPGLDDRVDLNGDAVPDCAQDLLTNGQISTAITGFFEETVGSNVSTAAFDADDASAWPHSGSIAITNLTTASLANAAGIVSACVSAAPGTTFDVWYHYSVPVGGGTGPQLITSFNTYSDSACAVPAASTTPGPRGTTLGGGWHVMHMGSPITLWPDWRSFEVRIELYKPGITTPLDFALDDLLLLQVQ